MTIQEQIEKILRPTYSSEFLRGLDLVRQMIQHGHAPEPDRITDEFTRGLEHGHQLVQDLQDAERVLIAIDEICLRAWLERAGPGLGRVA